MQTCSDNGAIYCAWCEMSKNTVGKVPQRFPARPGHKGDLPAARVGGKTNSRCRTYSD